MGTSVRWLDPTPDSATESWVSFLNTKDLVCRTGIAPASITSRTDWEDPMRQRDSFIIFLKNQGNSSTDIFSTSIAYKELQSLEV